MSLPVRSRMSVAVMPGLLELAIRHLYLYFEEISAIETKMLPKIHFIYLFMIDQ